MEGSANTAGTANTNGGLNSTAGFGNLGALGAAMPEEASASAEENEESASDNSANEKARSQAVIAKIMQNAASRVPAKPATAKPKTPTAKPATAKSATAKPATVKPKTPTAKPATAAANGTLGMRTAATVQADVVADIRKKVIASGITLTDKQIDDLLKIPTQIRAPLASLYQRDTKAYEKLANKYVKIIGRYIKKNGKKPPVEGEGGQKDLLGIEASALTQRRKAAAAGETVEATATTAVTATAATKKSRTPSASAKTKSGERTKTAKAATAAKPSAIHGPKLATALGYEPPKFFIDKYLKALEDHDGKVSKFPHEKFAKYCGVFATRKVRKNKGTARTRSAKLEPIAEGNNGSASANNNTSI
jgi:hypothetical protein